MKIKCVSTKNIPEGYLSINKVYLVVGIMYANDIDDEEKKKMSIMILNDYNLASWYDISLFEIVNPKIPENWTCNKISDDRYVISFKEYNSVEFNNNLLDDGHEEWLIFMKHYNELENWYRDMEIDDFFTKSDQYNINEIEKKTMIEYYKSLPDSTQWEIDKELLTLNRKEE